MALRHIPEIPVPKVLLFLINKMYLKVLLRYPASPYLLFFPALRHYIS